MAQQNYDSIGIDTNISALRGHSECVRDLRLAFAVSGIVEELPVEEGQLVKAGDLLIRLDSDMERIELERRAAISKSTAELAAARAQLDIAQDQWGAADRLYRAGGSMSKEERDNRRLARDLAQIEIERLETQEALEALDHEGARVAIERRRMHAPSLGIISEIVKYPGESVQAYEPVIALCDVSEIIFTANFPAFGSNAVALDDGVSLRFSGQSDPVEGRVKFVSPVVEAASGLRKVKVELINPPEWMRPGLGAELTITKRH